MAEWADRLTEVALTWRTDGRSIRDAFAAAAPPASVTADEFRAAVVQRLRRRPELVDAWQTYSYDKRATPSPFLDGLTVGFFDGGAHDVAVHQTTAEACADFLYRETRWVLYRAP